jgi:RNA polymerase sigma-70 factor (ECF subfamily)
MPMSVVQHRRDDQRILPGDEQDERALVARAQHDRQAFAPLYDHYVGPIYRYCAQRLGSREAAEDATSLVFIKALNALPAYRGGAFGGWLFAIAHNVVMDSHRTATASHGIHSLDTMTEIMDSAPSPEQEALAVTTLRSLLATLPEEQRRVLELRLAGLRGAEIAAALGRSVAAIKTLQYRAMCQLRADAARHDEVHND